MDVYLSNDDIYRMLDHKCLILRYSELNGVNDLMQLMNEADGSLILLYETSAGLGHWCCVVAGRGPQAGTLFVFDSYGSVIDAPLKDIPQPFRATSGQEFSKLRWLLANTPPEIVIDYNDHPLQALLPNVATCGRWAVARCLSPLWDSDQFARAFTPDPKTGLIPDNLVVTFTEGLGPQIHGYDPRK